MRLDGGFHLATHLVHTEQGLVLRHQSVAWFCQNLDKHVLGQAVEGHHHRQAAAELGDEAKLDQVSSLHQPQQGVAFFVVGGGVVALHLVTLVSLRGRSPSLAVERWGSKTQILRRENSMRNIKYTNTKMRVLRGLMYLIHD